MPTTMTTKVISLSSSSFLPVFSHYRFNPQMGIKVSVVYRVVPSDGWWPVLVSHWSRTPAIKETPTYNPYQSQMIIQQIQKWPSTILPSPMLHMALRVFVSFYEAHFIGGTYDAKVHALDEILHVGKFKNQNPNCQPMRSGIELFVSRRMHRN